jgi:hypothetical protein
MATHKDFPFPHIRNLSRPMSELLADPLSELTRKRQPALLIAATIVLLLSAGLAKVSEVGVANFKFELKPPNLATWLAFAITGYLLISYILGAWADWSIAKAKRWSPLAKIGDVKAEMDADQKARTQADMALSEEAHRLRDELGKVEAEIQPRLDRNRNRQREVEDAISSIKFASMSSEESAHLVRLAHESVELIRAASALHRESRDRTTPLVNRANEIVQSISLEPVQSMWAERGDIDATVRIFSRLTHLRLVFEIIFPAAYAVFALVWTGLHA